MGDETGGAAKAGSAGTAPPSMITPAVTYVACSTHPEEAMTNFCKTCKVFICGVCLDENHESHLFSSAKKQLTEMKQDADGHIEKLKRMVDEQKVALLEVKSSRDQQTKELADGLKAREQQETDAIAKLDRQKEDLIARVESMFDKKKLVINHVLTDSKSKLQTSHDEHIATLDASAAKMTTRCSQLENVVQKCEQIRASESVPQTNLYHVLPEVQQQVGLSVETPPPAFDSAEPLPSINISKNMNILQYCVAGVKTVTKYDQRAIFVKKWLLDRTSPTLKPDEACRKEYLVAMSAPSADSLVALLGEGTALHREVQGNGKTVLKQGQAGPVTHVLATVKERDNVAIRATHHAYLPINTPVYIAVEQALGFKISKAQEENTMCGFLGPSVQTKTVREWFQSSRYGNLDVWK